MSLTIDFEKWPGLNQEQVKERVSAFGFNELNESKKRQVWQVILEVIKEPMFILLIACAIIYLILGGLGEAWMLFSFVIVIIGITIYQENKTEKTLNALKDLSSPQASVIRGGKLLKIPSRELVPDDLVMINEGGRIPADAVVLQSLNLLVDESLLTGESISVLKKDWQGQEFSGPSGNSQAFVYSGTLVVKGQALIKIKKTGFKTEIGKIGKALDTIKVEKTDLNRQTSQVVKIFALVGLLVCIIVAVGLIISGKELLNSLLIALALAMSVLPEEFPVVLTIFLAMGAWRISRTNVLARRIPAVEALGAVSVLAVDKTGTLTMNKMVINKYYIADKFFSSNKETNLPEDFHNLLSHSLLSITPNPYDPMEIAIKEAANKFLIAKDKISSDWQLAKEYPLSDTFLGVAYVWQIKDKKEYLVAAKGSPEAILKLCKLNEKERELIMEKVAEMASSGLRVLAVASGEHSGDFPDEHLGFSLEFSGLLGLEDPVRPGVSEAIKECYAAGIRVVMITGDYYLTAQSIARQIGLKNPENFLIGDDLKDLNDIELKEKIKNISIFARIVPEQKLRLVQALKAHHGVVAMTGDGVNDAPALKAAHVGIAMGERGTDVAREAAALILLDDNFISIVKSIKMGRRIYDNIKKAITYIFSIHVLVAGLALVPVLFGWPIILYPIHIVFLELIIDPACSIIFEREPSEKDIMRRRPRRLRAKLFSPKVLLTSLVQSLFILGAIIAIYAYTINIGMPENESRTLAFVLLIVGNLGLILTSRSRTRSVWSIIHSKNNSFWYMVIGASIFLSLSIIVKPLRSLFRFSSLSFKELIIGILLLVIVIMFTELLKSKRINRLFFK